MHKNLLLSESYTITADEHDDGPAKYLADPGLYNCWRPAAAHSNRYWRAVFDFGSAKTADYWALAGFNISDTDPDVLIEYSSDNITYSTADSATLGSNNVFCSTFTSQSARYWRITVDAGSGNLIDTGDYISVLYFGEVLTLPRLMAPFTAPGIMQGYEAKNNISETGLFIGRSNYLAPFDVNIPFKNFTPEWVRSNLSDLINNVDLYPFFVQWNDATATLAKICAYCWTVRQQNPPRYTSIKYMSFDLKARGLIITHESDSGQIS